MAEIRLPSLGAEMDEGTLLEWYVKPGDRIEYGQIVALLDTEKAEIEMESFEAGWIDALLVQPGETIVVGRVMATVRSVAAGEAEPPLARPVPPNTPTPSARPGPLERPPEARSPQPAQAIPRASGLRVRATPLARRIAAEHGIALERLSGSGPGGAIVEADVRAAQEVGAVAPQSATSLRVEEPTDRAARRRHIIATTMERSKREIPHYYVSTSIEVAPALEWLRQENAERPVARRLLFPALLVKAVAASASRFPQLNGHWIDGVHRPADAVHLGMVVSLRGGGIIVPTIRYADSRAVDDVMDELRDVVTRARSGRLRSGDLSDATLSVTSLGEGGAETIFGVIYPPQVAIVGFGSIHPEARAEGDLLGTRPILRSTLAADHRASDGQEGSRFLMTIGRLLADPEAL